MSYAGTASQEATERLQWPGTATEKADQLARRILFSAISGQPLTSAISGATLTSANGV